VFQSGQTTTPGYSPERYALLQSELWRESLRSHHHDALGSSLCGLGDEKGD
jgi:hypothetical protein